VIDGKIVGFPFSLPAGKVGMSLGAEFRMEGFKATDSPEIFLGSTPIANIDKNRDITSQFAEVSVPIVGQAMNIPFVYNLELGLAGRHDHYEGVPEDAWVPKVSLRYQPIKDLTLRATYSNSFLAPNLYQTSGPSNSAFTPSINLGAGNEQAQVLGGANASLSPSTAETLTAGLVYSPSFVPGLVVSVDYFRILQQGIISTVGGTIILNDVQRLGPASPFANLVGFNNFPGQAGSQPVTAAGQLAGNLNNVFVLDTFQNLGASHSAGFDLSARYNLDLHTYGQLELGVNAVVFDYYDNKTFAVHSPYYNLQGLVGSEFVGALPDYKLTGLIEYRWNGFSLSLNMNYIPEMRSSVGRDPSSEDQTTFDLVSDYFTVDGRLSYTFVRKPSAVAPIEAKDYKSTAGQKETAATVATGSVVDKLLDGLTVAVGCNNMFDEQPPFIAGGNSNTDLSTYDPLGRFVYFEISKKF
jgi:iron complex outermembrane receptor protein